jgi:hypothetical protein
MLTRALHLDIFEQPEEDGFFENIDTSNKCIVYLVFCGD